MKLKANSKLDTLHDRFNEIIIDMFGTVCEDHLTQIKEKFAAVVTLTIYMPNHELNQKLNEFVNK